MNKKICVYLRNLRAKNILENGEKKSPANLADFRRREIQKLIKKSALIRANCGLKIFSKMGRRNLPQITQIFAEKTRNAMYATLLNLWAKKFARLYFFR